MAIIRHSFTETTITAHRDVVQAMRAMPRLTAVVVLLLILQGALELAAGAVIPKSSLLGHSLLFITYNALITPFCIAVHRYIILGEVTDRYRFDWRDPRFQRFFGWSFAMFLVTRCVLLAMGLIGVASVSRYTAAFAALILIWLVIVRSIILFPAIAVDAPGATPRRAFEDTVGHGWYIFFVLVLSSLPSLLVLAVAGGFVTVLVPVAAKPVITILTGLMSMLWIVLAVVIASRLYLGLGDRLNQDA